MNILEQHARPHMLYDKNENTEFKL